MTLRLGRRLWWGLPLLLVLLWACGLLTVVAFPGLPAPPAFTLWAGPFARYARDITSMIAVGCFVTGALLSDAPRVRRWAGIWTALWLGALILLIAFTFGDVRAEAPWSSLSELPAFLTGSYTGRVLLAQLIGVLVFLILAPLARSAFWRWTVAVIAMLAAMTPAFLGHGGLDSAHISATVSLGIHIGAVTLWVGGLVAILGLLALDRAAGLRALPRFSLLALWCVIIVGETGLLNASLRVGTPALFVGTTYGSLVILKAVALGWLILLGWQQRRSAVPQARKGNLALLSRIAGREFVLMAAAISMSVALSRIGAPTGGVGDGTYSPLSIVALGLGLPALAAIALPIPAWVRRLGAYPEVTAMLLLVAVAEVAGIDLFGLLVGADLSAVIGGILLMGTGYLAMAGCVGPRRRTGLLMLMVGWPIAQVFAAVLGGNQAGWPLIVLSILLAEAGLGLLWRPGTKPNDVAALRAEVSVDA